VLMMFLGGGVRACGVRVACVWRACGRFSLCAMSCVCVLVCRVQMKVRARA